MRWRKRREEDLERELRSHLELEAEEFQESGLPPHQARSAARKALGNMTSLQETIREGWTWTRLELWARDVGFGLRALRRSPGFSAVVIGMLALGIGANTAIFSVMDAVLLHPLPYGRPDRLVRIWQTEPKMGGDRMGTAPAEFAAYRDRTRAFAALAGYQMASYDLTDTGDPEHIPACRATANLFATVGVAPLIGRTFEPEEEQAGADKVAVLSYAYWKNRYGGDPRVLGTSIRMNEEAYRIIGVMPDGFQFPSTRTTPGKPPALWTPLSFTPAEIHDWATSFDTSIVARLGAGVTLGQAREDVRRVAQQFQREHPDVYQGNVVLAADAEHWVPDFKGGVPAVLSMLGGAVGLVLLIACANVANLLLARGGARRREISIRKALGAAPRRLMRQVFLEAAVLALGGGMAGYLLATVLVGAIPLLWSSNVNLGGVAVDLRALGFTSAVSVLSCVICGLLPAWEARGAAVEEALKQTARQSGPGRRQRRFARLLIRSEVALSVILLVGSGLLFRSFVHVLQAPLGFDPEHVLLVRTVFNRRRYPAPEKRYAAERTIVQRLAALPGVAAVGLTSHVPLADERSIGFALDGRPPGEFHWADNALINEEYFRAMRIPLLRGRNLTSADTPESPLVAVINQSTAAGQWPDQDPLGKGFRWAGRHFTVVGVVADVRIEGLDKPVGPAIYNSVYQVESGASSNAVFVLRTRGEQDPMAFSAAAQHEIWSVDHGLPILGFSTLHEVVAASLAVRRASLLLACGFTALAIVLSLIGIYSLLAYAITERTSEIGLRQALGAEPGQIAALVLAEGVRLTSWGILLGLGGAAVAGTLVSKLLFGVAPLDPVSFAAAALIILSGTLAASYWPARRAARMDPMRALRYQ